MKNLEGKNGWEKTWLGKDQWEKDLAGKNPRGKYRRGKELTLLYNVVARSEASLDLV